uniref:Uncharacterized protein n=1 Tax=Pseudomonas syringae pv. actinidiae TaxID=103796 RepID=A0A650D7S3_PSESF|nr:hypothetical protein [Pseudomonas syringae pv. actinidiae]
MAGVQHEFDRSCAIDPDKRYETALHWGRFRKRNLKYVKYQPAYQFTMPAFSSTGADDAETWQSANTPIFPDEQTALKP